MEYKTEILVRHYECDAYGHVNNAVYLNYLEHARSEYLKEINLDYKGFVEAGYGIYIAKVTINYKLSALPNDTLSIITKPIKRKRVSGVFYQQIKRGDDLICDAEVTWASVNNSGKMVAIPSEWDVPGLNVYEEN
ncbi:MAG: acyl-CoA thioesterase [Spirochaetaceae bacterium]